MTLQTIETLILRNLKYDLYADLSVDADAGKIADFSMLHHSVWLAREEIKLNCMIPALLKHATRITTVAGTSSYTISDTDFDLPIAVRYITSDDEFPLTRKSYENISDVVEKPSSTQGTPAYYIMFGSTSAGLSKIEPKPIPDVAGSIDIDYKPVLSVLTVSTEIDLIMSKYPMTVVKLASAYAFQLIRQDKANFVDWLRFGYNDFKEINLREIGFDYKPDMFVEELIKNKRRTRLTL